MNEVKSVLNRGATVSGPDKHTEILMLRTFLAVSAAAIVHTSAPAAFATEAGAVTGGIGGAAVGAVVGGPVGAVVGGVGGAAVGNSLSNHRHYYRHYGYAPYHRHYYHPY
jgi:hypothetical protein